ncbi:MAG: NADH-quinone oxidoreductase subunit NuoE [Actinomycetota bacterium]|nr:NADH-quinone oxidoreductase subunit NuoE [Actinomycetota bacterium]
MARLTTENVQRARDMMALYPRPRSAIIPVLHIAQEQDGWLTEDAMAHIAELLDITAAEVYGTASFYDMLFREPVGRHLISICTNVACMINGAYELLDHAEKTLGIKADTATADGEFTLEEFECIALCDKAPCLTVNWRFFGPVGHEDFDRLVEDLRAGNLAEEVPPHGTLCRVKRTVGLPARVPFPGREGDPMKKPVVAEAGGDAAPDDTSVPPTGEPTPGERVEQGQQPAREGAVPQVGEEAAEILEPEGSDTAPTAGGSRAGGGT